MTKKLTVCFAVIILVSPLFASLCFSQVDPEKALIGRWDGLAQASPPHQSSESTLVITSIKATGSGEWVGSGQFGTTGQDGSDTEINISSKNNEIYLEWVGAQGKAPVRVKVVGDNKLEGTIEAFDRGRVVPRGITFEKVKAGDVK